MNDFDRDLERGLHQLFDPYLAETPRPWRAPTRGRGPVLGGAGAAFAARVAMGVAVLVVAAGMGTEAVITQSLNPVDWGRQVGEQLQIVRPSDQHRPSVSPGAHPTSSAAAGQPAGATPSTPAVNVPTIPAVSPPGVPTVSPPAVPSLSPPALPTVTPTSLPTVP
jgi:hypothetical protein